MVQMGASVLYRRSLYINVLCFAVCGVPNYGTDQYCLLAQSLECGLARLAEGRCFFFFDFRGYSAFGAFSYRLKVIEGRTDSLVLVSLLCIV